MDLSQLETYAREKYQMIKESVQNENQLISLLRHPRTKQILACMLSSYDEETGEVREYCDIKSGWSLRGIFSKPNITRPLVQKGKDWVGVRMNAETDCHFVFRLFDTAVKAAGIHGVEIVVENSTDHDHGYSDCILPFQESHYRPSQIPCPQKLKQMHRLYRYGREDSYGKAQNFYRQAVFMQDYEDDFPWKGEFECYFPTYHDMTVEQLRGYFSWRKDVRRGIYHKIPVSAAYIYIYELLNGIGAESMEDAIRKLLAFEENYLIPQYGKDRIVWNLHRWICELAVLYRLPKEIAFAVIDPWLQETEYALNVLRISDAYTDEEVFSALAVIAGRQLTNSTTVKREPVLSVRLFSRAWREVCAHSGKDDHLFSRFFGVMVRSRWYPLSNAVYFHREPVQDFDYELSAFHSYHCQNGIWIEKVLARGLSERYLFQSFIHGTDAKIRLYLKCGTRLKNKKEDAWVYPFIDKVIEEDRIAKIEAAKPKVSIDLSGLEQIRKDANFTRDALLSEEEKMETEPEKEEIQTYERESGHAFAENLEKEILIRLLAGEDVQQFMAEHHLLPSLFADQINEQFYDEIGDTIVLCEENTLLIVDDYREEVQELLGGDVDAEG